MNPGLHQLYASLADGQLHSGADLARQLGITRAAVWKRIQTLRDLGLEIESQAGNGYRLSGGACELLDADRIRARLVDKRINVAVAGAIDSSNTRLAKAGWPHASAVLAEAQTAGRGRRSRAWLSPLSKGLYLSLGWHFESGLARLSALSLVVGMAVANALERACQTAVRVKWPNDLLIIDPSAGPAKFGGCLVELGGAAEGPCRAIVGIGINLYPARTIEAVDQTTTALARHTENLPGRNDLAAILIEALAVELTDFEAQGFSPEQHARWNHFDALRGRKVRVIRHHQPDLIGHAEGVDQQGQLMLRCGTDTIALGSGEVSIRVD